MTDLTKELPAPGQDELPFEIEVRLHDGTIWGFRVHSVKQAYETADDIMVHGYRRVGTGFFRQYPPCQITHVHVTGPRLDGSPAHQRIH